MSMTISTIAAEPRARSSEPGRGAVQGGELRARAGLAGGGEHSRFLDGLRVLGEGAQQRHRRDRPEHDRCDHPAVPELEVVAQDREPDPETDRADEADHGRAGPDDRDPVEAQRRRRRIGRAERDDNDPGHHKRTHQRRRGQQMQRENPVLEAHRRSLEGRFDSVGRHRQAAEADADGVEDGVGDRGGDRVAGRLAGAGGAQVRLVDRDHVDASARP